MRGLLDRGATAAPPAPATASHAGGRRLDPLLVAATLLAVLPIAVAVARAVASGWVPIGDHAYFAIRARDVLSLHPPLLGTWTSASLSTGTELNNPSPLLFDALALPVWLLGSGAGLAVGVGLINAASVVGVAVTAHRIGGRVVGLAAVAVAAALCWSMGSQLLFDPWQPHVLLLPFLWFLVLVWGASCGHLAFLPVIAGLASFMAGSHLSYGYLVGALCAWAVACLALRLRSERARSPERWAHRRRQVSRTAAVTGAVLAVCWARPIFEQVFGEGRGNFARMVEALGDKDLTTAGTQLGAQLVAEVVALPPWWSRPSFGEAFLPPNSVASVGFVQAAAADVPSAPAAWAGLAAVAAVLAVCAYAARRRGDAIAVPIVATAGVALVAGLVTASRMPLGTFGIAPHQFRWLWPLAAFVLLAVTVTVVRSPRVSRAPVASVLVGATAVVAVLNLPAKNAHVGPATDDWAVAPTRQLGEQLDSLDDAGVVLFDVRGTPFADPYPAATMAQLQEHGIPFVLEDPTEIRQLGPARRYEPGEASFRVYVRRGYQALEPPPGSAVAGRHLALDPRERDELARLKEEIREDLRRFGAPQLNDRGRAALDNGDLPASAAALAGQPADAVRLVDSSELVVLVRAEMLVVEGDERRRLERYADLQRRWDRGTVALFVEPLDPPS